MQRMVWAGFIQRRMEGQHVGLGHQLLQRPKLPGVAAIGTRRIAQQRAYAQRFEARVQAGTDVAHADDADGFIPQMEAIAFGQQHQGREHILDHRDSVAARAAEKPMPCRCSQASST